MCFTNCLSTATVVTRKRLNSTSYLRYLPWVVLRRLGPCPTSPTEVGTLSNESYVLPNTEKGINTFRERRKRIYIHTARRTRPKKIFLTSDRKRQFVTRSSRFPRGNLHPFAKQYLENCEINKCALQWKTLQNFASAVYLCIRFCRYVAVTILTGYTNIPTDDRSVR